MTKNKIDKKIIEEDKDPISSPNISDEDKKSQELPLEQRKQLVKDVKKRIKKIVL